MNFAIGIEYDGSDYFGWQAQKQNLPTIQAEVESALSKVASIPIKIICAGRTDKGVHATGQVCHFTTSVNRSTDAWLLGSNTNLPNDISITWCKEVSDEFHARFSAVHRRYHYLIDNRRVRSALWRQRSCWHYEKLDVEKMQLAANFFIGKNDFQSFRSSDCQAKSPIRDMQEINIIRNGDFILIDVKANAFLHHMVRNIAGVLIAIGDGRYPPEWAQEVLDARDRTQAGITSSPAGLYLVEVGYPEEFALPSGGTVKISS